MLREVEANQRRARVDALFKHMMLCIRFRRVIRRMRKKIRMRKMNVNVEDKINNSTIKKSIEQPATTTAV